MDIAFNIDDCYVRHMCVTMLSILANNKNVRFHVITTNLDESNKSYIEGLISSKGGHVYFYKVDNNILNIFPVAQGNSKACYLRLFIPYILPPNIDKVIYLDSDIVVIKDMYDLWSTDMQDCCIGAITDYGLAQIEGAKRMKLEEGYKYFNSGVLLLNLQMLRNMNFKEQLKIFMKENGHRILLHDQDILNGMLYKQRYELSDRWNMMCFTDNTKDYSIIHFAGLKPWHIECHHPLRHLYYQYLRETKWDGTPPTHKYSKWSRIKIKIKGSTRFRVGSCVIEKKVLPLHLI